MSSNASATAEVRTFPNAKVQPSTEAPEVPVQPVPVAPVEAPAKKKRSIRSLLLPIIGLGLLGAGSWYGYNYWTDGRFLISTDDAYVQADTSFVSPKISGYIDKVVVSENQQVKAGDPLFVIDQGDYKIAVGQAEAQIATLAKTLDRIDAQTKAAQASLTQAQALKIADQAAADNAARAQDRAAQLLKTHVGTQAQLDDAQTALDQAKAALAGADAQIAAAQANIGVLEAQRAESASTLASLQLTRDKAQRDLSFTVLKAPYDGVVGNRSVEQGDLVSPGQKLAVVVPMDKLYIVGNFKETQLGKLVPGEKVRITVDAIDGQSFEGTVSSLAPASGAVFSLLPPENATGNFTKVVQRVPVRIDVPADVLKTGKLRAGLSVVVAADTRTAPAN
ncbi:HlyD family secretion protein [Mesorhizobium sp.]|uniref:HlyD family secretion protein n=1 Tax=Mesorhizobium sp. TaxID=1871066 RepID=UPI0025D14C00|nr:HlyD family secretion protein [Mesorhizobium sp.]